MKSFIILILVALASAEWKPKSEEEFKKLLLECKEDFESKNSKYGEKEGFQIVLCTFRNLGVWNDTDGYSVYRIMQSLEHNSLIKNPARKNEIHDLIVRCNDKNTEGSSPFDWAYRCFSCFYDAATYTVKTREDLLKYRDECVVKLNTPQADLENYKKGDFPNDPTAHAYLNCILTKFGLFDAEKGFHVENIHNQMVGGSHADHTDDTHAKIDKCAKEAKEGPASEQAYLGAKCFMRENLQLVQRGMNSQDHDHSKH